MHAMRLIRRFAKRADARCYDGLPRQSRRDVRVAEYRQRSGDTSAEARRRSRLLGYLIRFRVIMRRRRLKYASACRRF